MFVVACGIQLQLCILLFHGDSSLSHHHFHLCPDLRLNEYVSLDTVDVYTCNSPVSCGMPQGASTSAPPTTPPPTKPPSPAPPSNGSNADSSSSEVDPPTISRLGCTLLFALPSSILVFVILLKCFSSAVRECFEFVKNWIKTGWRAWLKCLLSFGFGIFTCVNIGFAFGAMSSSWSETFDHERCLPLFFAAEDFVSKNPGSAIFYKYDYRGVQVVNLCTSPANSKSGASVFTDFNFPPKGPYSPGDCEDCNFEEVDIREILFDGPAPGLSSTSGCFFDFYLNGNIGSDVYTIYSTHHNAMEQFYRAMMIFPLAVELFCLLVVISQKCPNPVCTMYKTDLLTSYVRSTDIVGSLYNACQGEPEPPDTHVLIFWLLRMFDVLQLVFIPVGSLSGGCHLCDFAREYFWLYIGVIKFVYEIYDFFTSKK